MLRCSITFLRLFIFSFVPSRFVIACWNIFTTAAINSCWKVLTYLLSWCWHLLFVFFHSIWSHPDFKWKAGHFHIILWDSGYFLNLLWELAFSGFQLYLAGGIGKSMFTPSSYKFKLFFGEILRLLQSICCFLEVS